MDKYQTAKPTPGVGVDSMNRWIHYPRVKRAKRQRVTQKEKNRLVPISLRNEPNGFDILLKKRVPC